MWSRKKKTNVGLIMKCKCGTAMREKIEKIYGEKILVHACPKCGKELVLLKDAIKLQEKLLPKIETTRTLVKFGGSIAVTLPKELKVIFRKGEKVKVSFDPNEMEVRVKKV